MNNDAFVNESNEFFREIDSTRLNSSYQIDFSKVARTDVHFSSTYAKHVYCGECNAPAYDHPYQQDEFDFCFRTPEDILSDPEFDYTSQDYYRDVIGYAENDEDPYEIDVWDSQVEAINRYRDAYPDERTSATTWTYINKATGQHATGIYAADSLQATTLLPDHLDYNQNRNAYVPQFGEGNDLEGYTELVYDPEITDRYAKNLLNVYTDKQGQFRVGSLVLTKYNEFKVHEGRAYDLEAECLFCKLTLKIDRTLKIFSATATREEMEEFTLSVIRHGNNHGPQWLRERDTFYKVHTSTCDLNCNPEANACTVPVPAKELVSA